MIKAPGMLWLFAFFSFIALVPAGCGSGGESSTHAYKYRRTYCSRSGLNALVYLPAGYRRDPAKRWPVIIYLHGMNQRGNDLNQLLTGTGLPARIEAGLNIPFIVAAPQCPGSSIWKSPAMVDRLYSLVTSLLKVYRIDPKKINVTGFSMGGDGAWALAVAHHEIFAAVAPVGSYSNFPVAMSLKDTPVWVFHGQDDTVCPIANDIAMIQALQEAGSATVKFTVWPQADHMQSCTLTYQNAPDDDLYQWFAKQALP